MLIWERNVSEQRPTIAEQAKSINETLDKTLALLRQLRQTIDLIHRTQNAPMYVMGMFGPKLVK